MRQALVKRARWEAMLDPSCKGFTENDDWVKRR